ncbi:hypothetical protein BDN70DRAFT_784039, partial [Pholiota conissans]
SSPISRLPSELLSEIFLLCSLTVGLTEADMDDENSPLTVNPSGLDFTLCLSTVSRRWRNIINNQANLWSNIYITQNLLVESQLNTKQISTCLERSRRHPLNILIDARDPDWNWMEEGCVPFPYFSLMPVLFTSEHMSTTISLLLPHLSRWKSFTLLTDTWAPMHSALSLINPAITTHGAPILETLSLSRCNVLPSYYHDFQPAALKSPAFFSGDNNAQSDILPRLKNLLLEGVHVDWDALSAGLEASSSSTLESLELRYHCAEVRPTLPQYRRLLSSAPALRKLSIKCSGAYTPEDFVLPPNYVPVSLPMLTDLTVGYQTAEDGEMALELFAAPNVRRLRLEDISHYASADQDADNMLSYLASKASYSVALDADLTTSPDAQPVCERRLSVTEPITSPRRTYFSDDPLPPFPQLETVTFDRVDGSAGALYTLFHSLKGIQRVEIAHMSLEALRTLLPSIGPYGRSCPCPKLRSVVVHDLEKSTPEEYKYLSRALMVGRSE